MKSFIIGHWDFIAYLIIALLSLFFMILKKPKVKLVDTPWLKLVLKLPEIIKKAETVSPVGHEKKSFVLGVAYAFLADLTGKSIQEISYEYKDRISQEIEAILETPQKKEVI